MLRTVFYLLVTVVLLTLLRYVIGFIFKSLSEMLQLSPSARGKASKRTSAPPRAGELKRDPVCGTYVSTDTSVKRTVGGKVIHFCSSACKDKYKPD